MIRDYFLNRENLVLLLLLVDSRIPPQKSDLEFAAFAGRKQIPLAVVFTKADKQSPIKSAAAMENFGQEMKKDWEDLPPFLLSSAQSGLGRDAILSLLAGALDQFHSAGI